MKIRTAVLTAATGLMLTVGISTDVSAQSGQIYRKSSVGRRYSARGAGQAQQMVRQAYRDILLREPDPSGLREYTDAMLNRGWSDAQVRRALLNSPEHAELVGVARSGWRPRYR